MNQFEVVFDPRAAQQAQIVSDWWHANRQAGSIFDLELAAVVARLKRGPASSGRPYLARRPNVHRLLLRRTRYHVYFARDGNASRVLAIWHASRGKGPPL